MPSDFRFELTPEALGDIRGLLASSLSTWGPEQSRRYQGALDRAFDNLTRFPNLGLQRDDLFAGCRVLRVERHVVFYEVDEDIVRVARILHDRMDPR